MFEHPRLSRLLRIVEQNGKRRSKAREKKSKSYRSFFGSGQIKVTRGQSSKNFQNGFWTIKSLILKVEQLFWYHRVCLVKARRTMYNLTSGQVRARSLGDPSRSNYASFDAPCGDKRNDTNSTSLSHLLEAICFEPLVSRYHLFRFILCIEAGDVTHRRLGQNRNEDRFSKKKLSFLHNFFLTQICLFWHNSARNDENNFFLKNQNFDPPNFKPP